MTTTWSVCTCVLCLCESARHMYCTVHIHVLSLVHNVAHWGVAQLRDAAKLELGYIFCRGAARHPNAQHCQLGFSTGT